jgi:antirestriction protein ArdC
MNHDERECWRDMKKALATHNSFRVRQKFYPHNMDTWDKEHRKIESFYRTKLNEMLTTRLEAKKAHAEKDIEREVTRKKRASERIAVKLQAALNAANVRRSTRIANMQK